MKRGDFFVHQHLTPNLFSYLKTFWDSLHLAHVDFLQAMSSEKEKFKKFYLYGSVFWLMLIIAFLLGKSFLAGHNNSPDFFDGFLNIVLVSGIFGIPIIFLLSVFIRIAEYFINKIPAKGQRK